jgi:glycosyltransferase involved in cell wall biosynthesis
MKILTWSYAFWPGGGGMERIIGQITTGLAARGHELLVITQPVERAIVMSRVPTAIASSDPSWSTFGSVPVYRFPIHDAIERHDHQALTRMTDEIKSIRRDFGADVVHHAFFSGDSIMEMQSDEGVPRITANHQSGYSAMPTVTPVFRMLLTRSKTVVAVSQSVRRETLGLAPESAGKVQVIENGVEETPDPGKGTGGAPTILASGRFVEEKGFHTLLVAFALLLERQPHARLVLAGDGHSRVGLEHLAVRLGISERVTFTGWVGEQQMNDLIASSDIVAVPSIWAEPFGLTALEASERGRPVVVSAVGGLMEVVVDGVTGIHAHAGDPYSWASAFDQLIKDPDRAWSMGAAGRQRAHRELSLKSCIDKYESAFIEAIK